MTVSITSHVRTTPQPRAMLELIKPITWFPPIWAYLCGAVSAGVPLAGQWPMVLLGMGAGIAFNPIMLAAMNDVEPERSGLASGVVNTAFMMGGALGLAILASVAASVSLGLSAAGVEPRAALNGGYHAAFLIGALCSLAGAAISAIFLRPKPMTGAALAAAH